MSENAVDDLSYQTPAQKLVNVPEGLHELIRNRWSPRAFADRPVTERDLRLLLEAGRWAASSSNEQPWRFIVGRRSDPAVYEKILSILVPFNQQWAKAAPLLMLSVAKLESNRNAAPNRHAMHDTGAALAQIMLEAVALGLHAHGMGGFDVRKAHEVFGIPEGYEPAAVVAIGYLGSPESLPSPYRERELAPSERKPLSELCFGAEWGQALKL